MFGEIYIIIFNNIIIFNDIINESNSQNFARNAISDKRGDKRGNKEEIKNTADDLKDRLNLLQQLRDGTIKLSDRKFAVGQDLFIIDERPCNFGDIIKKSIKGDNIRFVYVRC